MDRKRLGDELLEAELNYQAALPYRMRKRTELSRLALVARRLDRAMAGTTLPSNRARKRAP